MKRNVRIYSKLTYVSNIQGSSLNFKINIERTGNHYFDTSKGHMHREYRGREGRVI